MTLPPDQVASYPMHLSVRSFKMWRGCAPVREFCTNEMGTCRTELALKAFRAAIYNQPPVTADRIAELLAPFLDPRYLKQPGSAATEALFFNISTYIDILLRWNSRINLTAIRDPEEIVTRHFGESLLAARHLLSGPDRAAARTSTDPIRVADVGSGAGFPGIPFKLWRPDIFLTLIESNHKKATFLREASRALTLTDINILSVRAEDLPANQDFDVVTLRAVERFDEIFPVASKLVAKSGTMGLLIGDSQVERAHSLGRDFVWQSPLSIPTSHSRILLIGRKQN